jgi:hypothetical protein
MFRKSTFRSTSGCNAMVALQVIASAATLAATIALGGCASPEQSEYWPGQYVDRNDDDSTDQPIKTDNASSGSHAGGSGAASGSAGSGHSGSGGVGGSGSSAGTGSAGTGSAGTGSAGTGSAAGSGSGGSSAGACVPGQQIQCPCAGGGNGVQACNAQGTGYSACSGCGGGGSGASAGSGGSGASAGSGGSSSSTAEDLCVAAINQKRASVGLPAFNRWTQGETCADGISENFSRTRVLTAPELLSCGANGATICGGASGTPQQMIAYCVNALWSDAQAHAVMSLPSYTQVACGFYVDGGGKVYAAQTYR